MSTRPFPRDATRETAGGAEAVMRHTKAILAAIQESKMALENQIATLAGKVGLLRDDHNKLKDPVKATEDMMGEMAPQGRGISGHALLQMTILWDHQEKDGGCKHGEYKIRKWSRT
ncbi:hypothetical protein NDU88_007011 [Pleurodeles waltl]|uniref:Uncharacterized protein n=1 Tax=Pleurodeles waltl TaxID=8319 RepID=A0AAV7NV06_PLEWA|nr:hypothetical protein NDU88_007011 [Pleurodeles waltl]